MQGENITGSPPWGSSRAGDLPSSSSSIQGDSYTRASQSAQSTLHKQPSPFQQCGNREMSQAWGRTKVKDLKHKLLQRGGSRGWSREDMACSQAETQLIWVLCWMTGGLIPIIFPHVHAVSFWELFALFVRTYHSWEILL